MGVACPLYLLLPTVLAAMATDGTVSSSSCSFPATSGAVGSRMDAGLSCSSGHAAPAAGSSQTASINLPVPVDPLQYVDVRADIYDMRLDASFVNSTTGQVKVAALSRGDVDDLVRPGHSLAAIMVDLKQARAAGAQIALLSEEIFGESETKVNASVTGNVTLPYTFGVGEPLDGPTLTAVRSQAKALQMYVIVPMRLHNLEKKQSYNAAVVIGHDGEVVNSVGGAQYYQKNMPCLGYPVPGVSTSSPNGSQAYGSVDGGGEWPLVPGQEGVQVRVLLLLALLSSRSRSLTLN